MALKDNPMYDEQETVYEINDEDENDENQSNSFDAAT